MAANLAQKLIRSHLVEGSMKPGEEIGLHIDQTLTQDATGTLVMLELEAMQLDRVQTEVSVQYVDHNLLQEDFKNPDDHLFLQSACQRFGLWFSRPGNGVSHPLHQEYFGKPGKTLLGSDSHTCSAGALGMLAIGAGGLEVAMAMAGFPFYLKMPEIWGVHLTGTLPEWVSAKDVILEMLRRHDVKGAVNRIIEYHGPGLEQLSAMDRHVIANMGAELGATATVFPADKEIQHFLHEQGRADDYTEQTADVDASYDIEDEIDLGTLEPLIALPSSPGNVHTVREQAGPPIYQAYIGSSANPGYRDFAIAAEIVRGRRIHPRVSLDINPSSRQILMSLVEHSALGALIQSGARIHQAGCNGCIGMGQAPATDQISLRTVPRNFPGRSGTREDKVCLVSPETAAASALSGCITDPRTLEMPCPSIEIPQVRTSRDELFQAPPTDDNLTQFELRKGPNIKSIPEFEPLPDELEVPILLKMRDNISTDEILPAGARVLPFRSNIPEISRFAFEQIDSHYAEHAQDVREAGGHSIVAGDNYGQGSSREHAALAPRYLGLRLVIAKSFARIHWQNLINFGIIPLTFENPDDYAEIEQNVLLHMESLRHQVADQPTIQVHINGHNTITARHGLSERQREILLAGGLINWARSSRQKQA